MIYQPSGKRCRSCRYTVPRPAASHAARSCTLTTIHVQRPRAASSVTVLHCFSLLQPPPLPSFLLPPPAPRPPPMSFTFTKELQLVLNAPTLPLHIDLGMYSCSWKNGKFVLAQYQPSGFRTLQRNELLQLMRRLHASPHAVLLNLLGHGFGEAVMQELAAPMAALSKLQVLVLSCA